MKPSLQLRMGQQLTLTPQLRQAIRLLQMSTVELEAELTEAIESNPLLERAEDAEPHAGSIDEPATTPDSDSAAEPGSESSGDEANAEILESPLDYEPDWDIETGASGSSGSGDGEDRLESLQGTVTESLHDHLLWQLSLSHLSARDQAIGRALIDAIGDDGYLQEDFDSVRATLRPEIEAEADELQAVLTHIQQFDPLGVGSRSLAECLCVQLRALQDDGPAWELAQKIAHAHLEDLARLGTLKLAQQLKQDAELAAEAVALLRRLDPKPGARFGGERVEYVAPDAYAWRQAGVWRVSLAPGCLPRVGINRQYEAMIGVAARGDASYLRGQLQEARWLIRSLETRADTILRVAECIVRQQSAFLEHGPEAMRPLVLREIADELELHESTISRVTTRKYLHTPRGTFEFKHFFSSGVSTVDGGSASSTAIQAMIKRLIDAESPRKPLSDARLTAMLQAEGISVARRTVAKYREAMNIPSSNERQRVS
ncbi:MAG: RNA polymerase factor sigma-54 [Lysobacterales bacterium]|jgi:RNA polymerase sigma-54 factor